MYGHSTEADDQRPDSEVTAATRPPRRRHRQEGHSDTYGMATHAVVVRRGNAYCSRDFIEMLQHVFGYGERAAYQLMRAMETVNQAVIWVGSLEAAEYHARHVLGYSPVQRATPNAMIPDHVRTDLPPVDVVVEPVNCSNRLPANLAAKAVFSERERLEHEILSRIDYRQLVRRSPSEIAGLVADILIAAGYRTDREPSLEAMKPVLVDLLRLADPTLRPEKQQSVRGEGPAETHCRRFETVRSHCTHRSSHLSTAGVQK